MDKKTAIKRLDGVDYIKEDVYIGVFPKTPLRCELCHQPKKYVWRDMEVEMDICGACRQVVDKLKKIPAENC